MRPVLNLFLLAFCSVSWSKAAVGDNSIVEVKRDPTIEGIQYVCSSSNLKTGTWIEKPAVLKHQDSIKTKDSLESINEYHKLVSDGRYSLELSYRDSDLMLFFGREKRTGKKGDVNIEAISHTEVQAGRALTFYWQEHMLECHDIDPEGEALRPSRNTASVK